MRDHEHDPIDSLPSTTLDNLRDELADGFNRASPYYYVPSHVMRLHFVFHSLGSALKIHYHKVKVEG